MVLRRRQGGPPLGRKLDHCSALIRFSPRPGFLHLSSYQLSARLPAPGEDSSAHSQHTHTYTHTHTHSGFTEFVIPDQEDGLVTKTNSQSDSGNMQRGREANGGDERGLLIHTPSHFLCGSGSI